MGQRPNPRHQTHLKLLLELKNAPPGIDQALAQARLDGFREAVRAINKIGIERQQFEACQLLSGRQI